MNKLEELSRKELQALAKEHGIKANQSNAVIIEQLMPILGGNSTEEKEDEVIVAPAVEVVEITPVVEVVAEPVIVENKVQSRKSILVLEEAPGPFTIAQQEEEQIESAPQVSLSVEDSQVGDVIEVLENGVWQEATIKRVNKVSFRVALHSTGREATVKMTDSRIITTASEETEPEAIIEEVAAEEPVTTEEEEEMVADNWAEDNGIAEEEEEEEAMQSENDDEEASIDEEDAITIPDEELIAGLMDEEDEEEGDDNEEEQDEEAEEMEQEYYEEEINDMAASEDFEILPSKRKSTGQKRTSSILFGATPKKARTSELPVWNSSTKPGSFQFEVGAGPQSAKKNPGSARKTFAGTPNVHKPAIVPKTNAAQKLRLEALQKKSASTTANPLPKKATPLVASRVTPITTKVTPLAAKITLKPMSEKSKVQCNFNERVKVAPTPSSTTATKPASSSASVATTKPVTVAAAPKKSSTTPNFSRMHQKQFNNSKPITSCVERNQEVAKKMEAAFAAATAGTYKAEVKPKPAAAKPHNVVKTATSFVSKSSNNLETKKSSFLKESSNKENTTSFNSLLASSANNVVVNAARVGAKEASSLAMSAKKEQRRDTYVHDSKVKREAQINKRRSAAESSTVPSNPFQTLVSKTPSKKAVPFH